MASIRELREDDLTDVHRVAVAAGVKVAARYEDWRAHFLWATAESRRLFADPSCPLGLVAVDEDAVLGYASLGYRRLAVQGAEEPAVVHNSLAVRPDAQGMLGLVLCRELAQRLGRDLGGYRILGLHHSKTVGMIWSRLGARSLDGSDMTCRLLVSPGRALASRLGLPGALGGALDRLPMLRSLTGAVLARRGFGAPMCSTGIPGGSELSEEDDIEAALADTEFPDRCQDATTFDVKRDADYLRWRYGHHPGGRHSIVVVRRAGDQVGLVILGPAGEPTTRLFEAMFVRDGSLDGRAMAHLCIAAADAVHAGVVAAKVTDPALAEVWQADGGVIERKDYNQFWYTGGHVDAGSTRYTYGDFSED